MKFKNIKKLCALFMLFACTAGIGASECALKASALYYENIGAGGGQKALNVLREIKRATELSVNLVTEFIIPYLIVKRYVPQFTITMPTSTVLLMLLRCDSLVKYCEEGHSTDDWIIKNPAPFFLEVRAGFLSKIKQNHIHKELNLKACQPDGSSTWCMQSPQSTYTMFRQASYKPIQFRLTITPTQDEEEILFQKITSEYATISFSPKEDQIVVGHTNQLTLLDLQLFPDI